MMRLSRETRAHIIVMPLAATCSHLGRGRALSGIMCLNIYLGLGLIAWLHSRFLIAKKIKGATVEAQKYHEQVQTSLKAQLSYKPLFKPKCMQMSEIKEEIYLQTCHATIIRPDIHKSHHVLSVTLK